MQLPGAASYNARVSGVLWKQGNLPAPLSEPGLLANSETFAQLVAGFQGALRLKADGKLGPATYRALRESHDSTPSEEDSDFPEGDDAVEVPVKTATSNAIIIDGQRVSLPKEMLDLGITASNFLDDETDFDDDGKPSKVYKFPSFSRKDKVIHGVIHETVNNSTHATIKTLNAKRASSAKKGQNGGRGYVYGVQLILDGYGHISCHGDLVRDRLVHGNQLNDTSWGIEVVNPYNPAYMRAPFSEWIPGPWWCWKPKGRERKYVLPTGIQMAAIWPLLKLIHSALPTMSLTFPTADLSSAKRRIPKWDAGGKPAAGIVAHQDYSTHADGRYLLEHCIAEQKAGR